jgi:predicted nucleic acid-binding protein
MGNDNSNSASNNTVFVDTSVLVAAENTGDQALYAATLAWLDRLWRARTGRTGSTALCEFYEQVTTAPNPLPQGDARAAIRRYQAWSPWKTDAATLETAWAVQARHQLAFGDCLAVACAQHSGCDQMLSLHLPHGAAYGGVTMVHPLQSVPGLANGERV